MHKSMLRINVGGRSARLAEDAVRNRHDNGRLAHFCSLSHNDRLRECDAYFDSTQEYYFERSPIIFEYVIDFYTTGRLHRPMDVCPIRVRYELDYWRIPMHFLARCCRFDDDSGIFKKEDSMFSTSEQAMCIIMRFTSLRIIRILYFIELIACPFKRWLTEGRREVS
ncbi:Potassium voltage-gated channel subfamily V member 2 [Toxocara canis]|uniref:Potassium voltage-gated channel subfamily V member 2 n=1 Tax=Toxocara canis TaxID=6265 RepID=A0A0B2VA37_TOXCA|nr:Potassium voltage-gated channel subfamily V member 2 [Toxocara canis]